MKRAFPSNVSDVEAFFVSELSTIERVIAFVCARHHLSVADAGDFSSHVKLKLIEDDYKILKKFRGRSSLRAYLSVVVQRLFLDYRINAWGRWRPSAEAKRAGAVAVLLEQLMRRDGHPFEEACELLQTNHRVALSRAELEELAGRLPGRGRRMFEGDSALESLPAAARSVDDVAEDRGRQFVADRIVVTVETVIARLSPQDALILAMRFEDGRPIAEIATLLHLDQQALYPRVQRLLRELRRGLEEAGIDAETALRSVESPAVSLTWKLR